MSIHVLYFGTTPVDSHITLGGIVLDVFGGSVAPLIKNSLELAMGKQSSLVCHSVNCLHY